MNNFIEWAKSPKGLIVLTIAALLALYLIVKRSENAQAAASGSSTEPTGNAQDQSTLPGNGTFNGPHNPPGDGEHDGQQAIGSPILKVPSFPLSATIRSSSGSTYDKQYGGVYYFATPATGAFGGKSVGVLPFGSAVSLIGSTQGTAYSPSGGSTLWYQLANGGWINSHDVTGV